MAKRTRIKYLIDMFINLIAKKFEDEPLDGDEVDIITNSIANELNYRQGNISGEQYNKQLSFSHFDNWFE